MAQWDRPGLKLTLQTRPLRVQAVAALPGYVSVFSVQPLHTLQSC